ASERVLERVPNTGHGDALLFRLDPVLQHRACPVTAGVKTAFAGWYFAEEPYPRHIRTIAESRA
ncbi:MAG TPA: 2OG-Fe(II) oxygenase, partial [Vicinamibacterales bacterium]